jgi:hypothetical protein
MRSSLCLIHLFEYYVYNMLTRSNPSMLSQHTQLDQKLNLSTWLDRSGEIRSPATLHSCVLPGDRYSSLPTCSTPPGHLQATEKAGSNDFRMAPIELHSNSYANELFWSDNIFQVPLPFEIQRMTALGLCTLQIPESMP